MIPDNLYLLLYSAVLFKAQKLDRMMGQSLSTAVKGAGLRYSHLERIYSAAIASVSPMKIITEALEFDRATKVLTIGHASYQLNRNVKVVAFGKAVLGMVAGVESVIGDHIIEGVASVPIGTMSTATSNFPQYLPPESSRIRICEGAPLNLPDVASELAAREILSLVTSAEEDELILTLISGGGSALLPCPVSGVTLEEKKQVIESLAKCGADINELNMFRKALSEIKGGRLAQAAYPSKVAALILSDVIGDPLETIASGPTVPNQTHNRDVLKLLDKYKLRKELPSSIITHLAKTEEVNYDVPIRNGEYINTQNVLVGTNKIATAAALQTAQALGYSSHVWSHSVQGEARKIGEIFALVAHSLFTMKRELPEVCFENCSEDTRDNLLKSFSSIHENFQRGCRQICLISGGEPTVTVKGDGRGGRNQELALAFAIKLNQLRTAADSHHCLFASVGTDGQDGPCNAAGAIVDGNVVNDSMKQNLDPVKFLDNNDSFTFFSKLNDGQFLIRTGLTGTNVMDVHVLLLNISTN